MIRMKLNPDKKHVEEVRQALKENGGYCPCAITKSEDTKCICKDFREQLERGVPGKCHCGMYVCEKDGEG